MMKKNWNRVSFYLRLALTGNQKKNILNKKIFVQHEKFLCSIYQLKKYIFNITMSDNKLVKTIMEAATLTVLSAGIGWIANRPQQQRHELRQVHRCHG